MTTLKFSIALFVLLMHLIAVGFSIPTIENNLILLYIIPQTIALCLSCFIGVIFISKK